jgi:malate synthase
LSQQAGAIATYQAVQQQLATLLQHGAMSTHEVASKLLTAANTYEAHERAKADKFSQMKAVK